jgi:thiamine-phosphate pyrophosphorylase
MDWRQKLRGFYAVLDRDDPSLARTLLEAARVLQIRLKGASQKEVIRVATWARQLTRDRDALVVVNDDLEAALQVGADAVHLGQNDLPIAEARRIMKERGASLLIGISPHNLPQVEAAVAGSADYLGFGPVFATRTKSNPDPVQGLDGLASAVRTAAPVPIVAIGGITPDRAAEVASAGAHAACAIAAVNQAVDPLAAAQRMAAAFLPVASE